MAEQVCNGPYIYHAASSGSWNRPGDRRQGMGQQFGSISVSRGTDRLVQVWCKQGQHDVCVFDRCPGKLQVKVWPIFSDCAQKCSSGSSLCTVQSIGLNWSDWSGIWLAADFVEETKGPPEGQRPSPSPSH